MARRLIGLALALEDDMLADPSYMKPRITYRDHSKTVGNLKVDFPTLGPPTSHKPAAGARAGRNVELVWLPCRLEPDPKTIADFRRDNGLAIRRTCAQFIKLCHRIGVLKGDCFAIDGSNFKAVNNRNRNFTKGKIANRLAHQQVLSRAGLAPRQP